MTLNEQIFEKIENFGLNTHKPLGEQVQEWIGYAIQAWQGDLPSFNDGVYIFNTGRNEENERIIKAMMRNELLWKLSFILETHGVTYIFEVPRKKSKRLDKK